MGAQALTEDGSVRIVCREVVLAHDATGEVHRLGPARPLLSCPGPSSLESLEKMWILTKGGAIKNPEEDV